MILFLIIFLNTGLESIEIKFPYSVYTLNTEQTDNSLKTKGFQIRFLI